MTRFKLREQPTGWELFHVVWIASLVAFLFGGTVLLACWSHTDFEPETGRDLRFIGIVLVTVLAAGVMLHYPWSALWARASDCRSVD